MASLIGHHVVGSAAAIGQSSVHHGDRRGFVIGRLHPRLCEGRTGLGRRRHRPLLDMLLLLGKPENIIRLQ